MMGVLLKRGTENGTERNGKRNETENMQCHIRILVSNIYTLSLYESPIIPIDNVYSP